MATSTAQSTTRPPWLTARYRTPQAYYLDKVLEDVDLPTFRVVDPDHPKNRVTSFAPYAKDARQVFY
jgi:hypothetical protein